MQKRLFCRSAMFAAGVGFMLGCGSSPLELSVLTVDLTGDVVVTKGVPIEFEIVAANASTERVVWGMGSSSCQFELFVEGEGVGRHNVTDRACTEDFVEQGLGPGETRSEIIVWGGSISVAGSLVTLAPGEYQLFATAGDYSSLPLTVTIVEF